MGAQPSGLKATFSACHYHTNRKFAISFHYAGIFRSKKRCQCEITLQPSGPIVSKSRLLSTGNVLKVKSESDDEFLLEGEDSVVIRFSFRPRAVETNIMYGTSASDDVITVNGNVLQAFRLSRGCFYTKSIVTFVLFLDKCGM